MADPLFEKLLERGRRFQLLRPEWLLSDGLIPSCGQERSLILLRLLPSDIC